MPKWGLTREMREARPWGLKAPLLDTKKVITDPVHGDIFITELERQILDSPPFQRLRRVRQLGTTHYVYPGATHTRFAHSLGTLAVAQGLMDAVIDQELGPHPQARDLFTEWRSDPRLYVRRVAEATVLARLGGLLHDLTHVPFGHSVEDDLGILTSHDANLGRYRHFWDQFPAGVRAALESNDLHRFIQPLVLSKLDHRGPPPEREPRSYAEMVAALGVPVARARQYEFVADIVGNTICADLLDYLRRDHFFAGLPFAAGERYLAYFYVTPTEGHQFYPARMVLRIHRDGHERADVISELLKHLRYRYELSERALVHHAKLAADAMVGKALSMWRDAMWADEAVRQLGRAATDPSAADIGPLRTEFKTRFPKRVRTLNAAVTAAMEHELRRRSDDGFVEWLHDWTLELSGAEPVDRRRAAIRTLTRSLLDRELYKPIARVSGVAPAPEVLYKRYHDPDRRRELEQAAARFAELEHAWRILLWVPEPAMRLKNAEVLVDTGRGIARFVDQESRGDRRGADIYDAHRNLWAIHVFVHADIRADRDAVEAILAFLSAAFEVRVDELGLDAVKPWEAPDLLAARRLLRAGDFVRLRGRETKLIELVQTNRRRFDMKPAETVTGRMAEARTAAVALRAASAVLRRQRFAGLRGREADLYESVLGQQGYDGTTPSTHAELVQAFTLAAEDELATLAG